MVEVNIPGCLRVPRPYQYISFICNLETLTELCLLVMVANDHSCTGLNNNAHAVRAVQMIDFALVVPSYLYLTPSGESPRSVSSIARWGHTEILYGHGLKELVDSWKVL